MDIQPFYIEQGTGFPLILLHGNGESSAYFVHQIEYFSKFYRVIAIDTRGHGQTPRGKAPFSISQFADDLLAFMEHHCIKSAHLLGFSDGGNIALTFTLRYPSYVDKLILNGANLFPAGVKKHIQLPIKIGYRIATLFSEKSPTAKRKAELLSLMVLEPNINPSRLHDVKTPTLVIAGTKDMIQTRHTELIFRSLPNSQLVWIHGDHFIANKQCDNFNIQVLKFLKRSTTNSISG